MLTAEGCKARRLRLWERLDVPGLREIVLADPAHVRYFANAYVTPISLGGDEMIALAIRKDGSATLFHDNRAPDSLSTAFVDEHIKIPWYDGQRPALYARQLALLKMPTPPMDLPGQPHFEKLVKVISDMRRRKDLDEISLLNECCRIAESGHDWALYNIAAGMTELDVFSGVEAMCDRVADEPVIVYGDFVVSPGPERRGGKPMANEIKDGDLFILDFSVVLRGYRCDFTNTVCVGGKPNKNQINLMNWCIDAMAAGEAKLKCGARCQDVYDAVRDSFEKVGKADHFPHHAGHGIGLMHPEPPYIVRQSSETLREHDVVTLEPGLYIIGIGGVRIEHNYVITTDGFERMSQHRIGLTAD